MLNLGNRALVHTVILVNAVLVFSLSTLQNLGLLWLPACTFFLVL